MPTAAQQTRLSSFSQGYQARYHEKPHIVAFVNSRSGGQIGGMLMKALQESIGRSGSGQAFTGKVCDLSIPDEPANTIEKLAQGLAGRGSSAHFRAASPTARERTQSKLAAPEKATRLLICGGDGTVTWILTALERCRALEGKLHLLPVAIVPLGTGNDLSRSLGWGSKLRVVSDVLQYLEWVAQATPATLDQWRIAVRPHEKLAEGHKLHRPGSHPQCVMDRALAAQLSEDIDDALATVEDVCQSQQEDIYIGFWQNYFSMGIDAAVAGYVGNTRDTSNCGRTCFRLGGGKVCYGWQAALHGCGHRLLTRSVVGNLIVGQPAVDNAASVPACSSTAPAAAPAFEAAFPETSEFKQMDPPLTEQPSSCGSRGRIRQFMLLNINSYCAGLNVLPRDTGSRAARSSPDDGMFEMLGVRNATHGVGIYLGIAKPSFYGAANRLAFRLSAGECMQLDGEPWRLDVGCDVLVEPHRKVTMLCAPPEAPFWCGHCTADFWQPSLTTTPPRTTTAANGVQRPPFAFGETR